MTPTLACLLLIDRLQPATAALLSAVNRIGVTLEPGQSLLLFEIQPTGLVDAVADVLLKDIDATPALFQLDGRVAYLGVTSTSISDLRNAAARVMTELGLSLPAQPGKLVSDTRVPNVSEPHAGITRALTRGAAPVAGECLLTMECLPAPLAIRALNEAEKEAEFTTVDIRFTGSMGRLKIAGEDQAIRLAQHAARATVEAGA